MQVDDVNQAVMRFYRDVLGFELMAAWPGAGFLSAGGYHHHIAVNTWNSRGASAPPPGSLGLVNYKLVLPTQEARDTLLTRLDAMKYPIEHSDADPSLRDSAGNGVMLTVA